MRCTLAVFGVNFPLVLVKNSNASLTTLMPNNNYIPLTTDKKLCGGFSHYQSSSWTSLNFEWPNNSKFLIDSSYANSDWFIPNSTVQWVSAKQFFSQTVRQEKWLQRSVYCVTVGRLKTVAAQETFHLIWAICM